MSNFSKGEKYAFQSEGKTTMLGTSHEYLDMNNGNH